MVKNLSKKSVILVLTSLIIAILVCNITVEEKKEVDVEEYFDQYQEEAYSIGRQEEGYQESK